MKRSLAAAASAAILFSLLSVCANAQSQTFVSSINGRASSGGGNATVPNDALFLGPTTYSGNIVGLTDASAISSVIFRATAFADGALADFSVLSSITSVDCSHVVTFGASANLNVGDSGVTSVDFSSLVSVAAAGDIIFHNAQLTSVAFPALTSLAANSFLSFGGCPVTSISFPVLASMGDTAVIDFSNGGVLTTVIFPSLTTMVHSAAIQFQNNAITSVSFPALTTIGQGILLDFSGNALPSAAVNALLHQLVLADDPDGQVDVSGGTSGAPTGQGITDKNTLITAGWTVTTN